MNKEQLDDLLGVMGRICDIYSIKEIAIFMDERRVFEIDKIIKGELASSATFPELMDLEPISKRSTSVVRGDVVYHIIAKKDGSA